MHFTRLLGVVVVVMSCGALAADGGLPRLKWVLTPYRTPLELQARYRPLAERLGARVGVEVELEVAPSFGAAAQMLLDGRADFGELTPFAFATGMEKGKLVPLAADAMVGRPGNGLVLVRADSAIRSVEQLAGVRFGFVDAASSTGYLGPWATLRNKGLSPKKLNWRFVGTHDGVLDELSAGRLDAGAVSSFALENWLKEKKVDASRFRILIETARMPGDVLCARPDLSPETIEALRRELVALSWEKPDDRKALEPTGRKRFVPVDVKEYGQLLRISAWIEAN
ncbi:MAG: phosphate/phosphite/phosphonate ABC transporter substrate-binding protein [Myxococcota bacterium]